MRRSAAIAGCLAMAIGCKTADPAGTSPPPPSGLSIMAGNQQEDAPTVVLGGPLLIALVDSAGAPIAGRAVTWSVATGGGSIVLAANTTGSDGRATARWALGPATGVQTATALVGSQSVTFTATAAGAVRRHVTWGQTEIVSCAGLARTLVAVATDSLGAALAGVEVATNVIAGAGTLGPPPQGFTTGPSDQYGNVFFGYHYPSAVDTTVVQGLAGGAPPARVTMRSASPCPIHAATDRDRQIWFAGSTLPFQLSLGLSNDSGVVTGRHVTWSIISGGGIVSSTAPNGTSGSYFANWTLGQTPGTQVAQAAVEGMPTPIQFTATALDVARAPVLVATVPMPTGATYHHDTFVRDGLAFVFAWNKGVLIYDVGNGMKGGSPSTPQLVSQLITSDDGNPGGPAVHNGWWFQNPITGEKRYLFVGQEGPLVVGASSSGDIHIVDVSNLAAPVEVGFMRVPGAGAHNFWMDEANQTLYAAFYNGGVAKIDVSGTLAGDMSSRIVARVQPGGPGNTYTWGVMLSGGVLYASDMLGGLFALDPATLAVKAQGPKPGCAYASDLWAVGQVVYQGNWSGGCAHVTVWSYDGSGALALITSLATPQPSNTLSDVAVTPDGKMLVGSVEGGEGGLYVWDRADPLHPVLVAGYLVAQGLHTAETKMVNGRTYVFAARNPPVAQDPTSLQAMMIFDITDVVH